MPDLVTHSTLAYLLINRPRFFRFRAFFYFGTILPDIISRPIYILKPEWYSLTVGMHTPVFVFILMLMLTELFERELQPLVFRYMLAGATLHFILDAFQRHLVGGYFWFFPLSWSTYNWGLFWPETTVQLFPVWVFLIGLIEVVTRIKRLSQS